MKNLTLLSLLALLLSLACQPCPEGYVKVGSGMHPNISSGTWELSGSATNHAGFSSASALQINWGP